jgi:hypothetical protein
MLIAVCHKRCRTRKYSGFLQWFHEWCSILGSPCSLAQQTCQLFSRNEKIPTERYLCGFRVKDEIATNIISARPEMEGSSQKGNNIISKLLAASPHDALMFNSRAANYLLLRGKYTSLKN